MLRRLIILFGLALIVRLSFAGFVATYGSFVAPGGDSQAYINSGNLILESGAFVVSVESMAPIIGTMSIYPWFIANVFKVFGDNNYFAIVIFQVLLDSMTVLAIALTARTLRSEWFWPAGLLAVLLPNLVFQSSLILTETVFVSFLSWALYLCIAAARSKKPLLLLLVAGIFFALAFNTRSVLVFFIVLFVPLQTYLLKSWRGLLWRDAFLLALVPMAIMWLSVVPRYITTYHHYGQATLSAKMGSQALYWMYPCLRKIEIRCTDRADSANQSQILLKTRLQNLPLADQGNPVIVDMISRKLARELLFEVPIPTVAGAMAIGGIRTLLTTSAYMLPPIFDKEPKFLSPASILGENPKTKVVDFLKTLTTQPLSLIWALCQGFLLLSRGFQLVGLVQGLRDRSMRSGIIFLLGILVYFLIMTGPIGYARFRIPIEPVLVILTAPSLLWLIRVITRLIRYS
jgi:4-amino-4-deoxy-L-arabinose transferase-like glycosyltransferase